MKEGFNKMLILNRLLEEPSKGFGLQAIRFENVATDHFQSADKRQKLSGKSRQFATATNRMQHNQTNKQFQFLLKSDNDI